MLSLSPLFSDNVFKGETNELIGAWYSQVRGAGQIYESATVYTTYALYDFPLHIR